MSPKAASAKSTKSSASGKTVAKSTESGQTVAKKPALPERQLDTLSQVCAALSRSTSLNEKLQLLRSSDFNESEKMELLQELRPQGLEGDSRARADGGEE